MLGSERLPSCLLLLLLGAVLLAAAGHASAEVIDATDSPGPQWLQQRCCSAAAPAAGCQCAPAGCSPLALWCECIPSYTSPRGLLQAVNDEAVEQPAASLSGGHLSLRRKLHAAKRPPPPPRPPPRRSPPPPRRSPPPRAGLPHRQFPLAGFLQRLLRRLSPRSQGVWPSSPLTSPSSARRSPLSWRPPSCPRPAPPSKPPAPCCWPCRCACQSLCSSWRATAQPLRR